jgi:hypothetical protein
MISMKYIVAFLACHSIAVALYMGNPAESELIDQGLFIPQDSIIAVKIGYQGDIIFDRKLRSMGNGRIDDFEMTMNQGSLTLNYLDRFELYGTAGAISSYFCFRPKVDNQRREFQTHDHLTGGGGGRFLLAQWGNTGIGIDGKIQWGKAGIKWITVNGVSHASGADLSYREWQASFAVYHTIDLFTPYFGIKYSNVHANVHNLSRSVYPHTHFKMYNRDRFGIALGCTLTQGKKFDLFGEVQLIDEQALTFGGNIKF